MSLRNGNSTLPTKFMASIDSYDDASIVMAGVPMTLPAASDREQGLDRRKSGKYP